MEFAHNITTKGIFALSYKHLTPELREQVACGIAAGRSYGDIAASIGRSKSTVSREVARNGGIGAYSCVKAQACYLARRAGCHMTKKLVSDNALRDILEESLMKFWSPEQAINRLELEVSVTTVYRAVRSGIIRREAKGHLRCHGSPYKPRGKEEKRGKIQPGLSIEQRPEIAGARKRLGDIEGDTVIGRHGTGAILTLVDRKSRYLAAAKLSSKGSEDIAASVVGLMSCLPCLTITFDNGKEFAGHKRISKELGVPVYFAHPHSPWERATDENTNKLLRQFFPKGTDFRKITSEQLISCVKMLNDRPRKCLGYKTPCEVLHEAANTVALGLTI